MTSPIGSKDPVRNVSLRIIVGEKTFNISVPVMTTIARLKAIIMDAPELSPLEKSKIPKFIHAGRILSQDQLTLISAGVKSDSCVHVVLADPPPGSGLGSVQPISGDRSASQAAESSESHSEGLRGFDRLLILGLSEEDVSIIRGQFYADVRQSVVVPSSWGLSETTRLLVMEEEWMNSQGPNSDFMLNMRSQIGNSDVTITHGSEINSIYEAYERAVRAQAIPPRVEGQIYDIPMDTVNSYRDNREPLDHTTIHVNDLATPEPTSSSSDSISSLIMGVLVGWMWSPLLFLFFLVPTSRKFRLGMLMGLFMTIIVEGNRFPEIVPEKGTDDDDSQSEFNPHKNGAIVWGNANFGSAFDLSKLD